MKRIDIISKNSTCDFVLSGESSKTRTSDNEILTGATTSATFVISATGSSTYPFDTPENAATSYTDLITKLSAMNPAYYPFINFGTYPLRQFDNVTLLIYGVVTEPEGEPAYGKIYIVANNINLDSYYGVLNKATYNVGITMSPSGPGSIIKNLIINCDPIDSGSHVQSDSQAIIVENCYITGDIEFNDYYGNISIAKNNVIIATGQSCGITAFSKMKAINNVIYDASRYGILCPYQSSITIENNIVDCNNKSGAIGIIANNSLGDLKNNDTYRCPGGDWIFNTNPSNPPISGQNVSGNLLATDPIFTTPGTDFTLQSSSPCKTAGIGHNTDSDIPTTDFTGTNRSLSAPSMGALEYVVPLPAAVFSGTPLVGLAPLTVAFTDASTNSPTAWAWSTSDGQTSTAQNPSFTFQAGTFDITLTATNAAGSSTLKKTAYVVVSNFMDITSPNYLKYIPNANTPIAGAAWQLNFWIKNTANIHYVLYTDAAIPIQVKVVAGVLYVRDGTNVVTAALTAQSGWTNILISKTP